MSDLDHARHMFSLARDDLRAMENMLDPEKFTAPIFGFHAQQSVEKTLKAWLSLLGIQYPLTHDIHLLLKELEVLKSQDIHGFAVLADLTDYAVAFRYNADEQQIEIDRLFWLEKVKELVRHVEGLF
ncbi:MAG: HEPN domain-containing protein [Deltaproteobacteria bacterium]|nr:HEPN domain-containing protein [Deltaproteobacteria bacterium]MDH4122011.1 HEPN domain-containing protein [Deltaproteobacteria bacterium]